MLGICTHGNKYLDLKYKYSGLNYKYKYKYFKHVLEYNSSTSTSTKYTSLVHLAESSNVVVLELPYSTEFGHGRAAI